MPPTSPPHRNMHAAAALRGAPPVAAGARARVDRARARSRSPRSQRASWHGHARTDLRPETTFLARASPRAVVRRGSREDDPAPAEELDFITRMVVKVFGQDALDDPEPMGLKRMSKEEWPDQWPALCDGTAADALASDDTEELVMIRAVLKQTQLEYMPLGIAYDAATHGWRASSFHTQCDGQGAALLVAESTSGIVFGGYNPKGWLGYGEWLDAISAFLFVFDAKKSGKMSFSKLGKTGGSGMAIIDEDGKGPKWGPDGLSVDLENRLARSRLGTYYATRANGSKSLFGDQNGSAVQLKSLRVYVSLGDSEKAKNYEPNMFQWKKGELEAIRARDPDNRDATEEGAEEDDEKSEGFKFPWQR